MHVLHLLLLSCIPYCILYCVMMELVFCIESLPGVHLQFIIPKYNLGLISSPCTTNGTTKWKHLYANWTQGSLILVPYPVQYGAYSYNTIRYCRICDKDWKDRSEVSDFINMTNDIIPWSHFYITDSINFRHRSLHKSLGCLGMYTLDQSRPRG